MTHVANFGSDWIEIMREMLTGLGISFDAEAGDEEISLTFWNTVMRRVPRVPRLVHRAKTFPNPAPEQSGLDALLAKFTAGDDVNAHLSRGRLDQGGANFHDGLLNDWGIQHFHLGANGARTNDCLFAVVTDAAVYCLDVLGHGKYGEIDLIERIHDTWPQLIAKVRMTIPPTQTPPTATEIMKARRAGISPLIQLTDGTVYAPTGGGVTTAKVGASVVSLSDYGFEDVRRWQDWFDQVAPANLAREQANGVVLPAVPTFTLMYEENTFYACEKAAKLKVKLGVMANFPIA